MWSLLSWPLRSRPVRRVLLASVVLLVRRRLTATRTALEWRAPAVGDTSGGRSARRWLLALLGAGGLLAGLWYRRQQEVAPAARSNAPQRVPTAIRTATPTAPSASASTPGTHTTSSLPEPAPTTTPGDGPDPTGGGDVPDLVAGEAVIGRALAVDDLKAVEGVGPKIEQLLNDSGLRTWHDLAAADVERLRGILADAGARYRMHDPTTWPQQAALLEQGDWDGFTAMRGGRED